MQPFLILFKFLYFSNFLNQDFPQEMFEVGYRITLLFFKDWCVIGNKHVLRKNAQFLKRIVVILDAF